MESACVILDLRSVNCEYKSCKNKCSGNGICDYKTNKCICSLGFIEEDCSKKTCLNECNKNGQCIDNECLCDEGYFGFDCSKKDVKMIVTEKDYATQI